MTDPAEVTRRLRRLAAASDLATAHRLATKVDLSAAAVERRLRTQSRLRDACGDVRERAPAGVARARERSLAARPGGG